MPVAIADQAESLVRRARVGDQNAMALIKKIGEAARDGANKRAKAVYSIIKKYIERNPAPKMKGGLFGFGGEFDGLPAAPQALLLTDGQEARPAPRVLPPLPRGAFEHLFDPEAFPIVVVRACQYRDGLGAAAVVLAAGPSLNKNSVQEMGLSLFGSDETSGAFFHGVKFCTPADLKEAKSFDNYLRRPFVVGQCVGRAWRIQAVRRPGSRIGLYAPVAGWEMGE